MRLLHTTNFFFKEFIGTKIPPYAIISHRWSEEEVSHQDFLENKRPLQERQSENYGWLKIAKGCEIALRDGFEWMWIDTCCIDKKSSAELSEAINSMFAWYRDSQKCYVFLPDVSVVDEFDDGDGEFDFFVEEFKSSSWFTRAWTLQELIAPQTVLFFNSDFQLIGDKMGLEDFVEDATGFVMPTPGMITNVSVSERMRLASKRTATRVEDMAYSLLGIFGTNMPLLYGEGENAFRRLQLELIRQSDDESIFAWKEKGGRSDSMNLGLLAHDASLFLEATVGKLFHFMPREHYEVTNKGIRIICNFSNEFLDSYRKDTDISFIAIMPLNIGKIGHKFPCWWSVPCLRFRVFTSALPAPYFGGMRIGLEVVECEKLNITDIEKSTEFFKNLENHAWDAFCGKHTERHTAIPVYFSLQTARSMVLPILPESSQQDYISNVNIDQDSLI